MTLNDICYEQIKDTFWYGIYGDFKLVIDKSTDCFNATKLCEATGKRFRDWFRLDKSKELIEYYNALKSPPTSPSRDEKAAAQICAAAFYEITLQNNDKINPLITGTYLCKDLILSLATWISNDFYHKCSNIVNHYFVKDFKEREQLLQDLIISAEEKMKKLCLEKDATIEEQKCKIRDMEERLTVSTIDRVPKSQDTDLRERFVVLKHKEGEYYVIRGQDKYCANKVKAQTDLDPSIATIIDLAYQPNSRNLFIRLKELQDEKFFINGNYIETKHEEELIKVLGRLNEEKYNI